MITRRVHLAAKIMSSLSKRGSAPMTVLAKDCSISPSYTEQLLVDLRRSGVVEGQKGPGGGYRLTRAAAEITLLDIANAVVFKKPARDNFERRLNDFLSDTTLASIAMESGV